MLELQYLAEYKDDIQLPGWDICHLVTFLTEFGDLLGMKIFKFSVFL